MEKVANFSQLLQICEMTCQGQQKMSPKSKKTIFVNNLFHIVIRIILNEGFLKMKSNLLILFKKVHKLELLINNRAKERDQEVLLCYICIIYKSILLHHPIKSLFFRHHLNVKFLWSNIMRHVRTLKTLKSFSTPLNLVQRV